MNPQQIKPFIHPLIQEFLKKNYQNIFTLKMQHEGPVHIIFPDIFSENIEKLTDILDELEADYKICFAHKANKSDAFILEAKKKNIWVDVASVWELQHIVSLGFTWENITCSWPKSESFLFLALSHNALISIDSISELESIISLQKQFSFKTPRIMIRLNDLAWSDRKLVQKYTKFWISQQNIETICEKIKNINLKLEWIHFHFDESNPEIKAGALENAIEIMKKMYNFWYTPNIIDIWWWYRGKELNDFADWKKYIDFLSEKKSKNKYSYTWGNRAYWLHINQRWGIEGREIISNRYKNEEAETFLQKMLTQKLTNNIPLIEEINDSMFSIYLEPGYSLVNNTWISFVKIIGIKTVKDERKAVILDTNITNFSSRMWEYFLDPILIKKEKNTEKKENSYFLFGNLCRDDDILIQKEVFFDTEAEVWDIICFINTASYISDFEDAHPIQQTTGKKLVAKKDNNTFFIYKDNLQNSLWFTQK